MNTRWWIGLVLAIAAAIAGYLGYPAINGFAPAPTVERPAPEDP